MPGDVWSWQGWACSVPCAPRVLQWGRGICHRAGSQLCPSCPMPGACTVPPACCGSQPSFAGCLSSVSSSLQHAIACWQLEIIPVSVMSPGGLVAVAAGGHLVLPTSRLATRTTGTRAGHGQPLGAMWRRKRKRVSGEGAGACPVVVMHGGPSPAYGICEDSACAEATLQRCPSRYLCLALLLSVSPSCAWLGSASQFSPSKCLGGSGR